MSHGYPDDFGQSIWPKYGNLFRDETSGTISTGNSSIRTNLSVQGIMQFLSLEFEQITNIANVIVTTIIDGKTVTDNDLFTLRTRFGDVPSRALFRCSNDDRIAQLFTMQIAEVIPFGESFVISVFNGQGSNLLVTARAHYYIIQ